MNTKELTSIIESHEKWLKNIGGQKADLTWADLTGANLTGADLTGSNLTGANLARANLTWANLTRANLTGANIDFASWPLWCGSKNVKIDERIARQLFAHVLAVAGDWIKPNQRQLDFANGFHQIQSGEFPKFHCNDTFTEINNETGGPVPLLQEVTPCNR